MIARYTYALRMRRAKKTDSTKEVNRHANDINLTTFSSYLEFRYERDASEVRRF